MKLKKTICALAMAMAVGTTGCKDRGQLPNKDDFFNNTVFAVGDRTYRAIYVDDNMLNDLAALVEVPRGSSTSAAYCFYTSGHENYCAGQGKSWEMDDGTMVAINAEVMAEQGVSYNLELTKKTKDYKLK